jgi:predicted nucleic acid-binding protein
MTLRVEPAPVIVDASVAVAVVAEANRTATDEWASWRDASRLLLAPPIFWPEIANALVRGRGLPATSVHASLDALRDSGIETADRGPKGLRAAVLLADRHGLSVYDATYLWLAIEVDGALATHDRRLATAARSEGIELALD